MVTNRNSASPVSPNAGMRMSPEASARMRATEEAFLRYYNDMGKNRGNCTWGIGFYVHRGVCSPEELQQKVVASSIEVEYGRRLAEAERRIRLKVKVPLNQAQFDGLVSFTYNTRSFTNQRVYDALNSGSFITAAALMSGAIHVKVDGKQKLAPGLIIRRTEESRPFRITTEARVQANK